jgi:hypothetical protein
MEELVTLKKFNTLEEASGAVELLVKNNIHYIVEKNEASNDIVFAGNTLNAELLVKVKTDDYETALKLLEELTEVGIEKLDKDYYLFEFSDKELLDILEKPDEWSLNDYLWAQEILKQRGKEVDKTTLDEWKQKRLEFLAQPEKVTGNYILTAYILCFLGGIIGFFLGRHVKAFRKLLPNGQKVYAYDEESRKKGKNVEIAGLLFMAIYVGLICFLAFS